MADMAAAGFDPTDGGLNSHIKNVNANGQATKATSSPVVLPSDQIVPVQSSRLGVIGQAPGIVNGINTDLIPSQDTTGYTVAVLQLAGTWSMTLQAQQCNDNANFLQTQLINAQTFVVNTALASTMVANGLFIIPLSGQFLRVRASAWASNASLVGTLNLYTTPPPFVMALAASYFSLAPQTSGGPPGFHLISAATTNLTNIKSSIGQVYSWNIENTNAAWRYLKFHNTAGAPTAGSGVVRTVGVPPNNKSIFHTTIGIPFSTGIGISTVTGPADSDTTAVGLNDLLIDIDFK
jgi:hypothetical protein